ncbi:hypothetical protein SAMN02745111_02206 [Eubacterium uniforme]|uniref:Uncharacterized protein n=1 Tax=Eubacterium uniforme TaxID=39495 RepID=A0A1T4W289_9FIRM|nr:hypothetical protein [Eubacterium uniforme]SKA71366.1 hypothetical protein SAMN02745111_02206 [Eubacterium uniforme]
MRKSLSKMMAMLMVGLSVFSMTVDAAGKPKPKTKGNGTVYVPRNCSFRLGEGYAGRSGNENIVIVKADSVYPAQEGVEDTYKKCQTVLRSDGLYISDYYVLEEGKKKMWL